jgi:hypothetical protein
MNDAHLPDVHSQLRNDPSGARRAELQARLRALRDSCLAAKRELCDREAYGRLQAASVAVSAAIRIVEALRHEPDGN